MTRAAALALVLFAVLAGDARAAQELPVYVVEAPLPSTEGAYGLLVPGAGPDTSREQALVPDTEPPVMEINRFGSHRKDRQGQCLFTLRG